MLFYILTLENHTHEADRVRGALTRMEFSGWRHIGSCRPAEGG